jgi:transcriptional regulator with PAS, ATPase and Fis domain
MPYDLQTRLLRVIEEGVIRRVGGTDEIPIDVRIIAATNKNLREEVEKGNFRKDLYYRLNVLPIRLPPLRERKIDIPLFIDYFMDRKSRRLNKKEVLIKEDHMRLLMEYDWPGNIRELENFVELVINTEGVPLTSGSKFEVTSGKKDYNSKDITLDELEKAHILKVLKNNNDNISKTAKTLGIGRNTLYRKLEKHEINAP